MKNTNISEGHWEIAPEKYPNSILPKERKAKRHGILAHPEDRERFMKNMGLSEDSQIQYNGDQMEPELAGKPTPDFGDSWKKIELPDPPTNNSSLTHKELKEIEGYVKNIDKKKRAEISSQDIPDLEDLFFDILEKHNVEFSHKLYNHMCDLVEQVSTIGMHFKKIFNRARPKQLLNKDAADKIKGGKTAKSASYPSTHAMVGVVLSEVFSKLYPKYADEFYQLGKSLGINRIVAGYHFRSDYNAGVDLANQLLASNLDKIVKKLKQMTTIKEAVVGSPRSVLDEIRKILLDVSKDYSDNPNMQEYQDKLNSKLFRYNVVMNGSSPVPAGAVNTEKGAMAVIRTPTPRQTIVNINTIMLMISHELVHVQQITRAERNKPGVYADMERDYMDRVAPRGLSGGFDYEAYNNDKYEIMASARTSVDNMLDKGMSKEQIIQTLKLGKGLYNDGTISKKARNAKLRYALDYAYQL